MTRAEKIAAAIARSGLKQEDLAKLVGVWQSDLSRWSNGRRYPTAAQLHDLAKLVGVPTQWLLDDERQEPIEVAWEMYRYIRDLGYEGIRARIIGLRPPVEPQPPTPLVVDPIARFREPGPSIPLGSRPPDPDFPAADPRHAKEDPEVPDPPDGNPRRARRRGK